MRYYISLPLLLSVDDSGDSTKRDGKLTYDVLPGLILLEKMTLIFLSYIFKLRHINFVQAREHSAIFISNNLYSTADIASCEHKHLMHQSYLSKSKKRDHNYM